jgi:hypothetical protein
MTSQMYSVTQVNYLRGIMSRHAKVTTCSQLTLRSALRNVAPPRRWHMVVSKSGTCRTG